MVLPQAVQLVQVLHTESVKVNNEALAANEPGTEPNGVLHSPTPWLVPKIPPPNKPNRTGAVVTPFVSGQAFPMRRQIP